MSTKRASIARLSFVIVLLILSAQSFKAQTPVERPEKIRAEVEKGDYAAAIAELKALRASEPAVFELNNYDYLLARLSQKRGDAATAGANYQSTVARNSLLTQYAFWHLAQLARATGNLMLERVHLRRLLLVAPASLLREAASARLAQSFFESGDYASVIEMLRPRAGTLPPGPSATGLPARASLALLGQAYLRSGQTSAAREVFNSLITQLPDPRMPDDFALAGARGLDVLDNGGGNNTQASAPQSTPQSAPQSAPQLPETEHLRRALIYSFNRDFAGARLHYAAIVERYPQSASVPDALYQTGRTFYQEGQFDEAINYFKRVLDQYSESQSARDALSFMASAYARTKHADEAIAAYQRFIQRYPDAPNPERPYLNIIDALRDAGRDQEALNWVQQTRARFKGEAGAALALFSQTRLHLAQGAWAAALSDIDSLRAEADLGGARLPGGTNRTELSFLRAFTLEQLGRTEEALSAYLAIPDGRNEYYGGRATRRLRNLAADERTRNVIAARLESLRSAAQDALAHGQAESARQSAQGALRLTEDANVTLELLEIARRAYASLPAYSNFPVARLLPQGRQLLSPNNSGEYASGPPLTHHMLADELLFLGLYDEGTPELALALSAQASGSEKKLQLDRKSGGQAAVAQGASDKAQEASGQAQEMSGASQSAKHAAPDASAASPPGDAAAYTLALFFLRGERADHAVRFAEPLWKKVPADYLLELAPREMLELLYPAPYTDALLQSAPQRGVDPRFILAIARQESRFQPEAKSVAAARGLLQFIPSTSAQIAAQLGAHEFQQDELYDPRRAILFGAQYMGNLFRQFPNMPQAVAASYNGGEDNVARWVARARSNDPDRYVPEIGFTQSKDYVFKVLPNYWTYQMLYTEQLRQR